MILSAKDTEDDALDRYFRTIGQSLRTIVREIPPCLGLFTDSQTS